MAAEWEVTGRLGELQMQWLKRHYSEEQLDAALAKVTAGGQRGYPLNVARLLQKECGGPAMPLAHELLERDPLAKERAALAKEKALQRLRRLREGGR